ncbi:hypothetical protein YC2023_118173 [Brassica napus]
MCDLRSRVGRLFKNKSDHYTTLFLRNLRRLSPTVRRFPPPIAIAEGLAVKILSDGFTTVSLSPISSYFSEISGRLSDPKKPSLLPFDHCGPAAFSMDHKLFTERGPSI